MPDWKQEIARRLAPLRLPPTREASVAEELAQHLEDHYGELMGRGASAAEARRSALAGLGPHEMLRGAWPEDARGSALAGLDRHELLRRVQQVDREGNWEQVPPPPSSKTLSSGM